MLSRIYIKEVPEHVGEQVLLKGFVHALRIQGSVSFLILRDVTGTIQNVIVKSNADAFAYVKTLSLESTVEIVGMAKKDPTREGRYEVEVETIKALAMSEPELPIAVNEKNEVEAATDIRHQYRFLDLRKPKNMLIMKLSSAFDRYYREYLFNQGFVEVHTPKTMPTPSESSSDLFEVKYFDRPAYLAQSPQLYKQMAIAAGLEKVLEVGPIFRAEKSFTSRHATECTSYDVEMAFIKDHNDIMELEENLIVYILTKIKENYGDEIKAIYGLDVNVPSLPFPRITMAEAKKLLGSKDFESDLTSEEEKALGDYFEKQGQDFVFLTDFPISVRPFYHKYYTDKPCTKSADLIYRGLEITTLAQREERYDVLVEQLKAKGLGTKDIQWYLDFFRYGMPPHGGWGLGGARFIMKLLGIEHIRDAMFIYRGVNNLNP
ncbi:MAG: aspartate--tRNA(Asn) ligase [Alphaproteobacteria bacterium]|nr:aspartate--tRNA(Asn) ligase [Alphaproteobacteria bacterium]